MIGSLENSIWFLAMLVMVVGVHRHQKVLGRGFDQKSQCHTAPSPQLLVEKKHHSGLWEVIPMAYLAWVEMPEVWMGSVYSSCHLLPLSSFSTLISLNIFEHSVPSWWHYLGRSPNLREVKTCWSRRADENVPSQLPASAHMPCFSLPLWTLEPKLSFSLKLILAMVFLYHSDIKVHLGKVL